jgi:hypothetical protein
MTASMRGVPALALSIGMISLPLVHAQGTSRCTTEFCRVLRQVVDARGEQFKTLRGDKRKTEFYFWDADQYGATKALTGLSNCAVYRERDSGTIVYGCAIIIGPDDADQRVEDLAAQAALAVPGWSRLSYEDPDGYKSARFGPPGSRTGQVIVEYIPREGENLLLLVEVLSR